MNERRVPKGKPDIRICMGDSEQVFKSCTDILYTGESAVLSFRDKDGRTHIVSPPWHVVYDRGLQIMPGKDK